MTMTWKTQAIDVEAIRIADLLVQITECSDLTGLSPAWANEQVLRGNLILIPNQGAVLRTRGIDRGYEWKGEPSDWLIRYGNGEVGICKDATFKATYVSADNPPAEPDPLVQFLATEEMKLLREACDAKDQLIDQMMSENQVPFGRIAAWGVMVEAVGRKFRVLVFRENLKPDVWVAQGLDFDWVSQADSPEQAIEIWKSQLESTKRLCEQRGVSFEDQLKREPPFGVCRFIDWPGMER